MAIQRIFRGTVTLGAASAGDSFFIGEGYQAVTGNNDYSGVNTSVTGEVARGFIGQLFTAANPWKTAFSTRLIYAASAGDLYHASDSADTETTALVQVIGGGHYHAIAGSGTSVLTRLEGASGRVSVANGVTVTTARFAGGCDARLEDTGTGVAITTLDVWGGVVYCQRPVTTVNLNGGTLVLDADSAGGVNAITTLNVNGGLLVWRDSGTITTLNYNGGKIDVSALSGSTTGLTTVTDSNVNMLLPDAQQFLDLSAVLITFTNTPQRRMTDGRPI